MPLAIEDRERRALSLRRLLLAGLLAAAPLTAAAPPAGPQLHLEQKARLVESVIMRAARAVAGHSDADLGQLAEARRLLDAGRGALAEGRREAAAADLDRALTLAVQFAGRQQQAEGSAAWLEARYRERLDGVRAFRRSFDDVVREKGLAPAAVLDLAALEATVGDGERLAAGGRYAEADRLMRQAYDTLAQTLTRLRDRETLAHRLVFATPADEYVYEMERYRSHELLLQMMGSGRPPEARRDGEQFLAAAAALAGQARAHAAEGDYQRAIEAQESATEQLVRALREAGLFLPN